MVTQRSGPGFRKYMILEYTHRALKPLPYSTRGARNNSRHQALSIRRCCLFFHLHISCINQSRLNSLLILYIINVRLFITWPQVINKPLFKPVLYRQSSPVIWYYPWSTVYPSQKQRALLSSATGLHINMCTKFFCFIWRLIIKSSYFVRKKLF